MAEKRVRQWYSGKPLIASPVPVRVRDRAPEALPASHLLMALETMQAGWLARAAGVGGAQGSGVPVSTRPLSSSARAAAASA